MPFPEKFRSLILLAEDQVIVPDFLWLAYAVCAVEKDSCGWRGWIIEDAWKTGLSGGEKIHAQIESSQKCPDCGRPMYRTGIEKRYALDGSAGPKLDHPYESLDPEFE